MILEEDDPLNNPVPLECRFPNTFQQTGEEGLETRVEKYIEEENILEDSPIDTIPYDYLNNVNFSNGSWEFDVIKRNLNDIFPIKSPPNKWEKSITPKRRGNGQEPENEASGSSSSQPEEIYNVDAEDDWDEAVYAKIDDGLPKFDDKDKEAEGGKAKSKDKEKEAEGGKTKSKGKEKSKTRSPGKDDATATETGKKKKSHWFSPFG